MERCYLDGESDEKSEKIHERILFVQFQPL